MSLYKNMAAVIFHIKLTSVIFIAEDVLAVSTLSRMRNRREAAAFRRFSLYFAISGYPLQLNAVIRPPPPRVRCAVRAEPAGLSLPPNRFKARPPSGSRALNLAVQAVCSEPVSLMFPCKQGKIQGTN